MSKTPLIREGGLGKAFANTSRLVTHGDGTDTTWVPKDERRRLDKSLSENGTYYATDDEVYAYSKLTVNVPGGASGETLATQGQEAEEIPAPPSTTDGRTVRGTDPETGEEVALGLDKGNVVRVDGQKQGVEKKYPYVCRIDHTFRQRLAFDKAWYDENMPDEGGYTVIGPPPQNYPTVYSKSAGKLFYMVHNYKKMLDAERRESEVERRYGIFQKTYGLGFTYADGGRPLWGYFYDAYDEDIVDERSGNKETHIVSMFGEHWEAAHLAYGGNVPWDESLRVQMLQQSDAPVRTSSASISEGTGSQLRSRGVKDRWTPLYAMTTGVGRLGNIAHGFYINGWKDASEYYAYSGPAYFDPTYYAGDLLVRQEAVGHEQGDEYVDGYIDWESDLPSKVTLDDGREAELVYRPVGGLLDRGGERLAIGGGHRTTICNLRIQYTTSCGDVWYHAFNTQLYAPFYFSKTLLYPREPVYDLEVRDYDIYEYHQLGNLYADDDPDDMDSNDGEYIRGHLAGVYEVCLDKDQLAAIQRPIDVEAVVDRTRQSDQVTTIVDGLPDNMELTVYSSRSDDVLLTIHLVAWVDAEVICRVTHVEKRKRMRVVMLDADLYFDGSDVTYVGESESAPDGVFAFS